MKLRIGLITVCLITILLLISACGSSSSPPASSSISSPSGGQISSTGTPVSQSKYGGTLIWIRKTGIPSLGAPTDVPTQTGTFMSVSPVLETLVLCDDQERIVPWLAEKVDTSPDGKQITFTLRQGIKFHDGTDFNAQAVKYNLEGVLAANCSGSAVLKNVDSYEIINDYVLRLNLKKYDARLLLQLAQSGIGMIASPTALQKPTTPDNMAKDHLVGTGPFKFDSWAKDQYIRFVRWDGYWQKGKPYLDAIEQRNSANVTASIMSFKAGEVNMVEDIDPSDYVQLKQEGYAVGIPTTLAFVFSISPDSANPDSPFANQKVREALEYAIDKKGMTEGLGKGTQNPAYQLAAPKDPWYIQGLPLREYNPAKAKQLLAEAGYPDGFKCILQSDVRIRDDSLVALQTYFKAVGIDGTIDKADVARATTFGQNGWKGVLIPGFPNWSSFSSWTSRFVNTAIPYPSIAYPGGLSAYQEAWNQVCSEPDYDKRISKMKELLKQLYDQALIIPYYWDAPRYVTDGTVMDMAWDTRNTNGYYDAANVWLKKK